MMPSYYAGKTPSFADAANVDILLVREDVDQNFVTDFHNAIDLRSGIFALLNICGSFGYVGDGNFFHELYWWNIVLSEVSSHRLADAGSLYKFDQPDLDSIVTISMR